MKAIVINRTGDHRPGMLSAVTTRNPETIFAEFFELGDLSWQAKELRHWRD